MNTRAKSILTIAASALTLSAAQTYAASAPAAPVHATADSVNTQLMKSVSDLSTTASNLSEAILKLINSQDNVTVTPQMSISCDQPTDIIKQPSDTLETPSHIEMATPADMQDNHVFISEETDIIEAASDSVWFLPADKQPGGTYIWIPDENVTAVKALLNGETYTNELTANPRPSSNVDLNEMTYWRGDSIPMALPTKRLGRYDRKLYNWLIYPKGIWHIGLTANYGELNTEDMEILSLIKDIDLHGKIYSIKPSVSYFLRNNLCVGMRLAFTKGDMGINSFKVDIDEDMSFDLQDIKYTSDSYAAAVFIQQYFGLSRRGRFAVFNEAEVSVGTGNSHFIRPYDGELRDTRTKTQSFNINYSPGVSIMMMKNAAFNLSFGIFGFHLKDEKQWENGEESGSRFTSGINFRFNLFNINFGVSIII
ncbi:MAG: hypothetical protein K2I92_02915 [Muribaculaceae bacterium]|nr:hypothetical protein [Muribaculaceae bacterium]